MRTATALLSLALLAVTAPASADTWLGPGFPPGSHWVRGSPTKADGIAPWWFWWTWSWDKTNKTTVAVWPGKLPAGLRLVPPPEYDQPYSGPGKLQIVQAESRDGVRRLCPGAVFPIAGAYGCAPPVPRGGCLVVIAPNADLRAVGLWKSLLIRHEIAHCNGWPNDHRGALPIEDWATLDSEGAD
jgi:hypothetical protein